MRPSPPTCGRACGTAWNLPRPRAACAPAGWLARRVRRRPWPLRRSGCRGIRLALRCKAPTPPRPPGPRSNPEPQQVASAPGPERSAAAAVPAAAPTRSPVQPGPGPARGDWQTRSGSPSPAHVRQARAARSSLVSPRPVRRRWREASGPKSTALKEAARLPAPASPPAAPVHCRRVAPARTAPRTDLMAARDMPRVSGRPCGRVRHVCAACAGHPPPRIARRAAGGETRAAPASAPRRPRLQHLRRPPLPPERPCRRRTASRTASAPPTKREKASPQSCRARAAFGGAFAARPTSPMLMSCRPQPGDGLFSVRQQHVGQQRGAPTQTSPTQNRACL